MTWFDPTTGAVVRPVARLLYLSPLLPACALAAWAAVAATGAVPPIYSPWATAAIAVVALILLGVLRGFWHLLAWAVVLGGGGYAWLQDDLWTTLAAWMQQHQFPWEPVVRLVGHGYLGALGLALAVQVAWYGWCRLVGRPLPIYYDSWLGMAVKTRPRPDQIVAVVVYPGLLWYEIVLGHAFLKKDGAIALRSRGLSSGATAQSWVSREVPPLRWSKYHVGDPPTEVFVYSRLPAPLILSGALPPLTAARSLIHRSFNGFICETLGEQTEERNALGDGVVVPALPTKVRTPTAKAVLDVACEMDPGPTGLRLRVRELRLADSRLVPLHEWVSERENPRRLSIAPDCCRAVRLRLTVLFPDTVERNEEEVRELLAPVVAGLHPPLAGVEIDFRRSAHETDHRALFFWSADGLSRWLPAPRPDERARKFVQVCQKWLGASDAKLPAELHLDAETGELVGASPEFAALRLREVEGGCQLTGLDGGPQFISVASRRASALLRAVERVILRRPTLSE